MPIAGEWGLYYSVFVMGLNKVIQRTAGTKEQRFLSKARSLWMEGIEESRKNTPSEKEGAQYAISETIGSDIDAILKGSFSSNKNELYLGETSNFLTDVIGAKALPLYMPVSKAYSALVSKKVWEEKPYYKEQLHYHNLGKEKFIDVLYKSEDPVCVYVGNKNRIVIVTEAKKDNSFIVVIESLDNNAFVRREEIRANKTVTMYDRDSVQGDIILNQDKLLYYNKNIMSANLPGVHRSIVYGAVQESTLTHNIQQYWEDVNRRNKKNPRQSAYGEEEYLTLAKDPEKNKARLQEMVDEAAKRTGFTKRLYHGTPNGTFNTFADWSYFTPSEEYADRYQHQGASVNVKKESKNPKTYSVYVKFDNLFDTRNDKDRSVFDNEFYGKWGNRTPLSKRGVPDWTDGDDIVEFFEENDYDYDGAVVDEG